MFICPGIHMNTHISTYTIKARHYADLWGVVSLILIDFDEVDF